MHLTRRRFLIAATALLPARAWSLSEFKLGDWQITTLSDGHLELPPDFILTGMSDAEITAFMAAHNLPEGPLITPCNVTLLRDGTNTVLFDAGAGPDFQPTAGRLADALGILGVAPEEISHLIFTHGHPDHLWGLLDDFDEPAFPQAQMFIGGTEFAYWSDPTTVETIDPSRTTFAVGAKRRLDATADLLTQIDDADTPLPGIRAQLTPGHTPGHMSFMLGDEVLLVGDAIGNPHIAFENPEAFSGADQDRELAAQTRAKLMAELAASGKPMIGFHLPDGGIGRVAREGSGYRFDGT